MTQTAALLGGCRAQPCCVTAKQVLAEQNRAEEWVGGSVDTKLFVPAAVESIPVLAALQSAPVLHTLLYGLYKDLQKLNPRRCASFFSAGVEQDDFQEALHKLRTLAQCYETELEADGSEEEADSD